MVSFKYSAAQKGPLIKIARYAYLNRQWFNDQAKWIQNMRLDQSQVNKLVPFKCLGENNNYFEKILNERKPSY